MCRPLFIGLLAAFIMSAPAAAAGLKVLTVPPDASGPAITVAVWYPSADKPSPVTFGLFTALAAQEGKIDGHGLPLVVLSHGRGGSFVVHHDTAEHLADAGFAQPSRRYGARQKLVLRFVDLRATSPGRETRD